MPRNDRLLSQKALAKYLGRAPRKIRAWTEAGVLPTWVDPESGLTYYPMAAILEWEKSHFAPTAVPA